MPENQDERESVPAEPTEPQPAAEATEPPEPPPRDLVLLSPFRLPTQSTLYLGNEDVSCFLNGYTALWHPTLILVAGGPPRIDSPYDHEQPNANCIFALPENPPPLLPDDWDQRVQTAGALAFRATTDRANTLENLRAVLRANATDDAQYRALIELPLEYVAPFFGIAFGYVQLDALFDAMNHEKLIDTAGLWSDLQSAARVLLEGPDLATYRQHLESAVGRLQTAREVLYPVAIHLLDLAIITPQNVDQPLPSALKLDVPCSVLASGSTLEKLAEKQPEQFARLKQQVEADRAEVCGGCYVEREDPLLPLESQLWNLRHGMEVTQRLVGKPVKVHARARFGAHPQLPSLLHAVGIQRTVLVSFDDSTVPSHRTPVVSWPATDGKQVDAFCRQPRSAENPQTYFHVAHYLHESIVQDHAATFALLHAKTPSPWYDDWMELSKLAPVLGQWTTMTAYFDAVSAGDYVSPSPADDFHGDYLSERTTDPTKPEGESYGYGQEQKIRAYQADDAARSHPVSAFAAHARTRRKLDSAWTFAALFRSLAGKASDLSIEARIADVERRVESMSPALLLADLEKTVADTVQEAAETLARRLLSRADKEESGYLLLNPCSFARRVILDLPDVSIPVPIADPVKSCQVDASGAHFVVEVPALGFAWFPKPTGAGGKVASKMKMADDRCVRNEFFEAEVDPLTGGLKGLRDHKTRANRIGQQMVWNPGSSIRVTQIKAGSTGPAYGEIVSEAELLDDQKQVIAVFRQRFRAWLGRPVLDMRIEIEPKNAPQGYPWHAYFAARFAWRDERTLLLRGVNGLGYISAQTRPETPDYLELRLGKANIVILTGGLPFHQRHGGRMLDVILVPEGEQTQSFDLALGLDRDHPMLTAFGMVSPVAVVPAPKGPPHIGATGWLFHLDVPNLLLTSLRPAPAGADGVIARLIEVGNHHGNAEFRCVRDVALARQFKASGDEVMELGYNGDTVYINVNEGEMTDVRIDFTRETPPDPQEAS